MHKVKGSHLSVQDMSVERKRTLRQNYEEKRQRTRWTKEMNLDVIRCYFMSITTDSTSYRRSMHRYWKKLYPNTICTEQRIADQKKQIFSHADDTKRLNKRGNWLTELEIEDIKSQIIQKHGKVQVEYFSSNPLKGATAHCGTIASPKTNVNEVIESCLKILDMIKNDGAPEGVLLDPTKITKSPGGTYKKGKDYDILNEILGKGLNGEIVVARDKKCETDHALKTVMLTCFNLNEIRAWVSLEGCDHFPSLYMFKKTDGKIELHHEILSHAVTIKDIINDRMERLREHPNLLHNFSLYVLQGLLEASTTMHSKQWLHDDIHEENAMLQPVMESPDTVLKLRLIDFGRTKNLENNDVVKDIQGIIRIFTSIYVTQKFDDNIDLQKNWKTKLNEQCDIHQVSDEHRMELLDIVKLALEVKLTKQEINLKETVCKKLKDSEVEEPELLKNIAKCIFPERFGTYRGGNTTDGACGDTIDGGGTVGVPNIDYNVFVIGKINK